MEGKKRQATAVVSEHAAQAALRRGSAVGLAPDEERVLRMRLGASLPLGARLERIATATDAEIELLAFEIEAFLKLEARAAPAPVAPARAAAPGPARTPQSSRAKDKIVRALRKKP